MTHDPETTSQEVARCGKCGREFLTLPANHRVDRYLDKKTGDDPCGGVLVEVAHAA